MPEGEGFVSMYPEPRDIFIPRQWNMSPTGEFTSEIEGTLGIYVPLVGSERVEWVKPSSGSANTAGGFRRVLELVTFPSLGRCRRAEVEG